MSKLKLAFAAVALTAATSLFSSAQAIPGASVISNGLRSGSEISTMVEHVQYVRNGMRHCWYQNGWNGSGWYRCSFGARRGQGWGGRDGWNGWHHMMGPHYGGRYYGQDPYGGHHHGRRCCW